MLIHQRSLSQMVTSGMSIKKEKKHSLVLMCYKEPGTGSSFFRPGFLFFIFFFNSNHHLKTQKHLLTTYLLSLILNRR